MAAGNAQSNINAQHADGNTALHYAVLHSNTHGVRTLLIDSADINAVNNDGHTAPQLAIQQNHADIAQILLGAQAKDTA